MTSRHFVASRAVVAEPIRTYNAPSVSPYRRFAGVVLATMMTFSLLAGESVLAADSIRDVTTSDAANLIREGRGSATVVVFCQSACPRSDAVLSELTRLAGERSASRPNLLIFAIDRDRNAARESLARYGALLEPYWIIPWKSGELTSAMREVGISLGKTFGIPFIAVIDRDGRVSGQWEGVTTPRGVEAALHTVR